jgi:hypothetical protein
MPGSARAAVQCFFRPSRAEVAGLSAGTTESKGPEYMPVGQTVAELCRMAGADESLIPPWTEEGRRRAEAAQHPPFSGSVRPLHHQAAVRGSQFRLGPILLCRSRPQCRHGGKRAGYVISVGAVSRHLDRLHDRRRQSLDPPADAVG